MKPVERPDNPNFSSGPCSKRPGYDVSGLSLETLGRSHRSTLGKGVLGRVCTETAEILGLPEGYRIGVVPASDTGAVEMALWSLLGARPVDILALLDKWSDRLRPAGLLFSVPHAPSWISEINVPDDLTTISRTIPEHFFLGRKPLRYRILQKKNRT